MSSLTAILLAQASGADAGGALIDWWTVSAQVANFLLLVVLLRIFLYKRVIQAMDRREKKIAAHFHSAEQKEREATEARDDLQRQKQDLDKQKESILHEARRKAYEQRQQWTDRARKEVDQQADRWRNELRQRKEAFLQTLQQQCGEQACRLARRAIEMLADAELESRMVEAFAPRLKDLSDEDRKQLLDAAREAGGLTATTAWELDEQQRERLGAAVGEHLDGKLALDFQTAPELCCGIELRAGGHELSWTVASYLDEVRHEWAKAFDREARATATTETGDDQDESPAGKKDSADEEDEPSDDTGGDDAADDADKTRRADQ